MSSPGSSSPHSMEHPPSTSCHNRSVSRLAWTEYSSSFDRAHTSLRPMGTGLRHRSTPIQSPQDSTAYEALLQRAQDFLAARVVTHLGDVDPPPMLHLIKVAGCSVAVRARVGAATRSLVSPHPQPLNPSPFSPLPERDGHRLHRRGDLPQGGGAGRGAGGAVRPPEQPPARNLRGQRQRLLPGALRRPAAHPLLNEVAACLGDRRTALDPGAASAHLRTQPVTPPCWHPAALSFSRCLDSSAEFQSARGMGNEFYIARGGE